MQFRKRHGGPIKPKPQPRDSFEQFQAHFDQMLNPSHELIQLARKIDWPALDAAFADCYRPDIGAPAKAVRLMVGLHYLKYAFDESDESVVARWVENPFWQYFCGYTHMQYARRRGVRKNFNGPRKSS